MPASGLLALLDDVTTILDDVAAMSKIAAKKTAGIAGDDLAVNAQGLVGIDPSRELPIVGKVALGSFANKFVLIPLALALPRSVITPLLMLGGAFLCYEAVHKVLHKKDAHDEHHHEELLKAIQTGPEALAAVESQKVRQAIVTDVILSAEIVAVALGAVADEPFAVKASVLSIVSFGMTFLIYGLVASIVKVDDVGLWLQASSTAGSPRHQLGKGLVAAMPTVMRGISIVGTIAMFLVGGGIFLHGFHSVEEWIHHAIEQVAHPDGFVGGLLSTLASLAAGVGLGVATFAAVEGAKRAWRMATGQQAPAHH